MTRCGNTRPGARCFFLFFLIISVLKTWEMHNGPWTKCGHNENKTQQFYGRFVLAPNKDMLKSILLYFIKKFLFLSKNKSWPLILFLRVLQTFVTRILLCCCWPSVEVSHKMCIHTPTIILHEVVWCPILFSGTVFARSTSSSPPTFSIRPRSAPFFSA